MPVLRHPETGHSMSVKDGAVAIWRRSGWLLADESDPILEPDPPAEPASPPAEPVNDVPATGGDDQVKE